MAILDRDVEKVVETLKRDRPMGERDLREALRDQGVEGSRLETAVGEALARNLIRWVAFDGWIAGGRN